MKNIMSSMFYRELKVQNKSLKDPLFVIGVYLSLLLVFPLSLGPSSNLLKSFSPAIIWTCSLITFLTAIEKFFISDISEEYLEQLFLSSLPLSIIVLIKALCHWISVGFPLIILCPLISIFLNLPLNLLWIMCFSLFLGTLSFSLIGIMGAALVIGAKKSNVIVILIIIPLTIPILIFGISSTLFCLEGLIPYSTLYLQCMSLSFLLAISPIVTSSAIKIYLE